MLMEKQNYIKNATLNKPDWIPIYIGINDATWDAYRSDLEDVVARHPLIFPGFKKGFRDYDSYDFGPGYTKGKAFTDNWGCTWITEKNGIEGIVIDSPIKDWKDFDTYSIPDPNIYSDRGFRNWDSEKQIIDSDREKGVVTHGWLPHGFLFMRIQYLRGFENALIDMATEEPRLDELIKGTTAHNQILVKKYLEMNVDVMEFGEDLGTQTSTFISPEDFRKWIMPSYAALMRLCKQQNTLVCLHSDGHTLDILEDQIECGVDIVNPQDLCNGIDNLAGTVKGKACIRLDIDRQNIIPFGKRKDIFDLIEEEVRKLGSPQGGLELVAGIYPPTPPENLDALCGALEKYYRYWWE